MDRESGRCDRLGRVQTALAENGLSALVCSHNLNVLLLSGYWPVTGLAVAIAAASRKPLQVGEPVLVHCNSYADGYWTDLTRTYVLGEPDERLSHIFDAILAARSAALNAIRPGIAASEVDKAARSALADAGYGNAFRHPTGHGVGFSAINHDEWPRIHPCSDRMLEEGMVFNVEPGIYISGYGGIRDCNMVAVTGDGHELLTPFHLHKSDWCIGAAKHTSQQSG
jgi:Xaa-Pro aminopeptidase